MSKVFKVRAVDPKWKFLGDTEDMGERKSKREAELLNLELMKAGFIKVSIKQRKA